MQAMFKNETVSVLGTNKGWVTIVTKDGEKKVRQSALKPVPVGAERLVPADLTRYTEHKEGPRTASGRNPVDIADAVAAKLRGKDLDFCYAQAAKATGIAEHDLRKRYVRLNPGMQRMNLGNLLRGAARMSA